MNLRECECDTRGRVSPLASDWRLFRNKSCPRTQPQTSSDRRPDQHVRMTHSFPLGASGSQCHPLDYFTAESLNLNTDVTFDHTPAADQLHHNSDADLEWSAFTNSILNSDLVPVDAFVASATTCPIPHNEPADGDTGADTKEAIVQSNPLLDKMLALPLNGFKSEPDADDHADGSAVASESHDSGDESDDESDEQSSDSQSEETSDHSDEEVADKVVGEAAVKEEKKGELAESVSATRVKSDPDEDKTKANGACTGMGMGNGTGSAEVNVVNVKMECEPDVKSDQKSETSGKKVKGKKVKKEKSSPDNDNNKKAKKKDKSPRGKKRKSNLQRRNIKKMMSEDQLSQEVLDARREEQERVERQKQALMDFKNSQLPPVPATAIKAERTSQLEKEIDEICLSSDDDDPDAARKEMIELLSDEDDRRRSVPGAGDGIDADDFDANNCGLFTDDRFNKPDGAGRVLINVGHRPDEPDLFLSPQLAANVKPHQIGGIRFLYANVVESAANFTARPGVGCILAHSMGLGKTLQVISFIDVLFSSTDAKHVLCVVPINTLQNWIAEFDMWIPTQPTIPQSLKAVKDVVQHRRFKLYVLTADHKTLLLRSKELLTWRKNGGVLVMGYEMYRMLVVDLVKSRKNDAMSQAEFDSLKSSIQEALVNPGPDVVVCDEGHRIKNSKSGISHALKKIRTKRRIVLTGYPLQNNLMEYWCMVDFVRPNFLGSEKEFSNMFEKPIRNGTYSDSTPLDKKVMRRRSHVLYKMLAGFVQRRSHLILKNCLPTKFEHVFLTRLTPIQKSLLVALFSYLNLQSKNEGEFRISPIILFSICNKIWNHPDILYNIVNENGSLEQDDDVDLIPSSGTSKKKKKAAASAKKTAKAEVLTPFELLMQSPSTSTSQYFPSHHLFPATPPHAPATVKDHTLDYSWAEPCFSRYVPNVLSNSTKMVLLFDLMDKIINLNDRLLVFSQSLLTLNLIEKFMSDRLVPGTSDNWNRGFNYFRLDGSTPGLDRERFINTFNRNTAYKVFLLSTKAGGLGINLIGACRIILFDASWNPCHDAQAACRIYRYGQLKNCYIYRLVADNSLEKKIYDRQINKQGMSHRVVDELNPETKFKASEICSLIEGLGTFSEPALDPFTDAEISALTDPLVIDVCLNYRELLTVKPFEHESLLLDDKESRLSVAEKNKAMLDYLNDKRGQTTGRNYSYPHHPSPQNASFTNGSSTTTGSANERYPWESSQATTSQASNDFDATYRQQPIRPEYLNNPPYGSHSSLSNGQVPYSLFNDTKAKLMSRGFTDMNRLILSKDIVLNDKATGRPSAIRTGEQVFVLQNPQTGDRILLTNDCKIVSIPPIPFPSVSLCAVSDSF